MKARTAELRAKFESALYALFMGSSVPKDFGERFDHFANSCDSRAWAARGLS